MSRYSEQHADDLACEVCGNRAPVKAQLEDGEAGTYVVLCIDHSACMSRFHAEQQAYLDALERQGPLPVCSDEELPF